VGAVGRSGLSASGGANRRLSLEPPTIAKSSQEPPASFSWPLGSMEKQEVFGALIGRPVADENQTRG